MHYVAKLVFKSYMPKQLNEGMLFLTNIGKEMKLIELSVVPRDENAFIQNNGYPVEPYIIREGNPNLNDMTILATPEEIGWWDEGEHSDEYRDITAVEMDFLFQFQDSFVEILISDDDFENDKIVPVKYEGKVVIRTVNDYEEDDDDDDEEDDDNNKDDYYGDVDLYDYE